MIDRFIENPVALVFGLIALILSVVGFQANRRKNILLILGGGSFFWSLHFFLIGAFTGSALNGLAIFRNYTFLKYKNKYRGIFLPALFIVLFIIASIVTWQGLISILPLVGMTSGTVAFWQKNPRTIRLISLISPPMWIIYNFIIGSLPGLIVETFVFSSILIAIYRFDIVPRIKKEKAKKEIV